MATVVPYEQRKVCENGVHFYYCDSEGLYYRCHCDGRRWHGEDGAPQSKNESEYYFAKLDKTIAEYDDQLKRRGKGKGPPPSFPTPRPLAVVIPFPKKGL